MANLLPNFTPRFTILPSCKLAFKVASFFSSEATLT
ncbi:hypothetical protein [Xanthomarina gelatinilytica]